MTTLDPQRVSELLAQTTPGPWEYECCGSGTHRMWNGTGFERGYFMEDVDGVEKPDPNWELAALAPTLAADWLRMRRALIEWQRRAIKGIFEAPTEDLGLAAVATARSIGEILENESPTKGTTNDPRRSASPTPPPEAHRKH